MLVETDSAAARKAIVSYVGKVPEIAPGFWIGVAFERPDGKHDGAIGGVRYFKCAPEHGSFLRPNYIRRDEDQSPLERAGVAGAAAAAEDEDEDGAIELVEGETFALPSSSANQHQAEPHSRLHPPTADHAPPEDSGLSPKGARLPPPAGDTGPGSAHGKPKLPLPPGPNPEKKEKVRAPTARLGASSRGEDSHGATTAPSDVPTGAGGAKVGGVAPAAATSRASSMRQSIEAIGPEKSKKAKSSRKSVTRR